MTVIDRNIRTIPQGNEKKMWENNKDVLTMALSCFIAEDKYYLLYNQYTFRYKSIITYNIQCLMNPKQNTSNIPS